MGFYVKVTLLALLHVSLAVAAGVPETLSPQHQELSKITGVKSLKEIQQVFQELFQSSDIDAVLAKISKVTKQKDAISFLKFCNDITQKKTIQEASKDFVATTTENLSFIDVLDTTTQLCGHDLRDFYLKIVQQTGKKTLSEMFQVLKDLTGLQDLFTMFRSGGKYTKYTDPIEIHDIEFKATFTSTLQTCFAKLCAATNTPKIFQAYDIIKDITNADIVDIFKAIGTFKVKSWEEFIKVLTTYTKTSDFVSAMKAAPAVTGEKTVLDALNHIQKGLPPKGN